MDLAFLILFLAQAANTYTTTTTDVNGNRVAGPVISETRSKTASDITERSQSINGRLVPRERIEERVVRDDASGKVTERITRPYDQTGNPGTAREDID